MSYEQCESGESIDQACAGTLAPWHRAAAPQVNHKHTALMSQADWNNTFKSGPGFPYCKRSGEEYRDTELQLPSGHKFRYSQQKIEHAAYAVRQRYGKHYKL